MAVDKVTRTEILDAISDIERRLRCIREELSDPQRIDFQEAERITFEAFERQPPTDRILWRSCLSEKMD